MMLATATTTTTNSSFSTFLHTHGHLLLIVAAVVVFGIIAIKIIQHLVVIAALAVAGGIALIVLFPGFRNDVPGLQKKSSQVVHQTAVTLKKNKACDNLNGKLRTACIKRVNEVAKKTAPAAAAKAKKHAKK